MFGFSGFGETTLRPSEIRYSQDTINSRFVHGYRCNVTHTLKSLLKHEISLSSIPRIDVKQHSEDGELKGKYFAVDGHRRLYIYKKLEAAGKLTFIKVNLTSGNVRTTGKFTTNNNGVSIKCRDDPLLDWEVDDIINRYRYLPAVR